VGFLKIETPDCPLKEVTIVARYWYNPQGVAVKNKLVG